MQAALLSEQQAEMSAPGPGDTVLDQSVARFERNQVVRVVEQIEVESGFRQDHRRIRAQAAENRRNR